MRTTAEAIAKARGAIGRGCIYALGHGGMDPTTPEPWDHEKLCDCTGFLAWVIGRSRKTDDPVYGEWSGGWLNSAAIFRDTQDPRGIFEAVEWKHATPGDIVVFAAVPHGHVGLVTEVGPEGPSKVVHCSHGAYIHHGDAIMETGPEVFVHNGAVVASCAWLTA